MGSQLQRAGCRDGRVRIGRLSAGDRVAVLDVFEGMSERSRRLRYHGPKPRLPEREVDDLVDVGRYGREAVAAVDAVSGDVVGIARFVRDDEDPHVAEVAFEVVDECQSSGVGSRLVRELSGLAAREGVARVRASVVAGNEPALALLRRMGRVVASEYVDGAYELVVELPALERAAA
jgi:ribosomal protein S18 acetylase RimI-like enzyme